MTSRPAPQRDGRIRVLWVIKGLGPGGAERLLCAAARAHDHNRFHIECAFVLPFKDHLAEELEQAGVRTRCLSQRHCDRRWPLRLAALVRGGDWDVVHVHSPLPGSVARLATRMLPQTRRPHVVSTEHNRWATHRRRTRWLNRLTSHWDAVSFAVTDEVRMSMSGAVTQRAETLQHGIDVEATARQAVHRNDVRAELGFGPDEIVVGTVANFRPQKDYPNFLGAAKILADRDAPVRFVAVGQGPQEAETRRLQQDLGLQARVILTGFRNDAARIMGACDVFTLASQWEGLPVALMEALALGLPVVATAVGGVAEELVNNETALLVPPGDAQALAEAIERVVSDPDLRARLSGASSRLAVEFDVRKAVARTEDAYDHLASKDCNERIERMAAPFRRSLPQGLNIREATPDDRPAILALCRASLDWGDDPLFERLFSWKHDQNAFGPSYLWVATDGARIVGLRAFMRWEFVRGGEVLHAVRAVDTATHPDYQGKGLFTAMTMHGLEVVEDDGVDFVFNTPNDKSRPGYLKMGWQSVGRIPISVKPTSASSAWRMARSRVASSHWPEPLTAGQPISAVVDQLDSSSGGVSSDLRRLATRKSREYLDWRYGSGFLGYRFVPLGDGGVLVRLRRRGSTKELVLLDSLGLEESETAQVVARVAADASADYTLRIGPGGIRHGFLQIPDGGLAMTWRALNMRAMAPLANWELTMGDVELL